MLQQKARGRDHNGGFYFAAGGSRACRGEHHAPIQQIAADAKLARGRRARRLSGFDSPSDASDGIKVRRTD